MLSISELQLCQNENDSYTENIQHCLLIKINNETVLQIFDEDSVMHFLNFYLMLYGLHFDSFEKEY